METIKSVLGYGTKAEEGQEPVSGQQGTGNAVEPYDAGNSEDTSLGGKAPQATDATSTSTPAADITRPEVPTPKPSEQFPTATEIQAADTTASSGKPLETSPANDVSPSATTGASSTAAPTSTGAVDEPSATATSSTAAVEEKSTPESSADQSTKTGGIGSSSWFKSAIPFVGSKNKSAAEEESASSVPAAATSEKDTTTGASKVEEDPSTLPPNHLPTQVPEGVSTDLAPPQTPAPAEAPAATTTSDPTPTTTTSDTTPAATSSETKSSEPAASELPGTKASTHTSRFAEDDPDLHRGNNPSSIPTAGGKTLGVAAVEERKEAGLPADPGPNLPESAIGNPDATSAAKAQDHSGEKESVTSGSSGVGKEGGESGTGENEGKHKHHLLQKIKDKIKH